MNSQNNTNLVPVVLVSESFMTWALSEEALLLLAQKKGISNILDNDTHSKLWNLLGDNGYDPNTSPIKRWDKDLVAVVEELGPVRSSSQLDDGEEEVRVRIEWVEKGKEFLIEARSDGDISYEEWISYKENIKEPAWVILS